jgi:hypothetical protein
MQKKKRVRPRRLLLSTKYEKFSKKAQRLNQTSVLELEVLWMCSWIFLFVKKRTYVGVHIQKFMVVGLHQNNVAAVRILTTTDVSFQQGQLYSAPGPFWLNKSIFVLFIRIRYFGLFRMYSSFQFQPSTPVHI